MLDAWRDGAAKSAITDFVARITTEGGADYVPPARRIAVFDNDGTLWCEQPMQVQGFFLFARLEQLAIADPGLRGRQPFKAFLDHDRAAIHALGKKGIMDVMAATHAGMDADTFDGLARAWLSTARHPKLARLFRQCTYAPQVQLLEWLRSQGFRTFIVSGGGVDFIRACAEDAYGIPPEQVIGSSVRSRYELRDGRAILMKTAELDSCDDREAKPQNIHLHIGRRPILVFGNSDGDLAMMRYAKAGRGRSLALLLHHDDAEREMAYDRDFALSPLTDTLDRAEEYGITVVSMARDWTTVFETTPSEAAT